LFRTVINTGNTQSVKTWYSSKHTCFCPKKCKQPVLNEELYVIKFKLDIEFNEVVNLQSIKGSIEAGYLYILTALPGGGFYFFKTAGAASCCCIPAFNFRL